ncbi:MAG: hypothetical protein ACFHWZ_02835 [Phycisphaerales bacterium]
MKGDGRRIPVRQQFFWFCLASLVLLVLAVMTLASAARCIQIALVSLDLIGSDLEKFSDKSWLRSWNWLTAFMLIVVMSSAASIFSIAILTSAVREGIGLLRER